MGTRCRRRWACRAHLASRPRLAADTFDLGAPMGCSRGFFRPINARAKPARRPVLMRLLGACVWGVDGCISASQVLVIAALPHRFVGRSEEVMGQTPFSKPVLLRLSRTDHFRARTPLEALDYLRRHWPGG